ncbi:hypothetical protein LK533_06750 [Sphingomonas sp. PL-96]|uniref:hypothetical protein n=1 Tax=Sphingomonas sp. PL-96 TaxID=2887201 RepID=UPI001E32C3AB|nr:hypothetical protein [Sphingomonas sp. PL-96]MCC2976371.1 hypothetical protein [Sphingomonas sp. PL-96]
MKISRTSSFALVLVLAGVGLPALGQDVPESLLPPGFNDPVAPAPAPQQPVVRPSGVPQAPVTGVVPIPTPTPTPTATATPRPIDPRLLARYELPEYARRSIAHIGIDGAGLGRNAFGSADGRMLETLMRRLDAPVASRWLSIALRRALASDVDTPLRVNGPDFAAERAWLLLRMGEAPTARAVVQSVDAENYTPKMYQVALQAALATADPAAVCGIVEPAQRVSNERGWQLARAMCAGLAGEPRQAGTLLDQARKAFRRRAIGADIDLKLAEKVLGAGAQGRRSVTIEWDGVERISAWRWGLANATAVEVPDALLDTAGPQLRYWNALLPMVPPERRAPDAELAAAQGVLSSAALVDLYATIGELDDSPSDLSAVSRDLRESYAAGQVADRMTALRQLWTGGTGARRSYARRVLTARAAAAIPPAADYAGDADALVASMLSAGMDLRALRWRTIAPEGGDAWAMLALADPRARQVSEQAVSRYADGDARKGQLLFAGLAGLGRLPEDAAADLAQSLEVPVGAENAWTRAISLAAGRDQPGAVLVLAAAGMQTADWRGVSPQALFHIVAALRAVGLEGEARMIAAEAIARA